MKSTYDPILVTQIFDASLEDVWNALTVHEEMTQWYFSNIPAFEAVVGFKTKFIVKTEERTFPHVWKVTEVRPLQKIAYEWTFEGYSGSGISHFELVSQGTQTKLNFSFVSLEAFPQDIPEFRRESGVAGWKYFIQENLKAYLSEKSKTK